MNLNILRYCTLLISVLRHIDVVTCQANQIQIIDRKSRALHNINNNNPAPLAGVRAQDPNTFHVSDSDEDDLEVNVNNSSIPISGTPVATTPSAIPGRTPVATTPIVKATSPAAKTISLADTDFEGKTSMPRPMGAAPVAVAAGARPVAVAAGAVPVAAASAGPRTGTAVPVAATPQVVAAAKPRMPVTAGGAAQASRGISLADTDIEGPAATPRPKGATPIAVAGQPMRAAVPAAVAAMPRAVPVAATPVAATPIAAGQAMPRAVAVSAQPARSRGISLADTDIEGPAATPRPKGVPPAVAARPAAVAAPMAARPAPRFPGGPPFAGPAPPTKVMVSGQAPGSARSSKFEDIPLSDVEDLSSKSSKFEDIPLSGAEDDFRSAAPKTPIGRPPIKAKAAGAFEDIALSDTEGFDPIGPPPGARMMPKAGGMPASRPGSSGGSADYEELQIDGFSDMDSGRRGAPPKMKAMPGAKADDILLSDAGEFEDILVETDTEGMPKGPRRAPGFGAAARGPPKAGGEGSVYEVKVQDRAPEVKVPPKPAQPRAPPRKGYVESLKLVIDVSKKWSTDELEYKRNDARRMDVFTAVDPHLIYKVKNFDDTLWQAKDEAYAKMVEIETLENKPPLVTVYMPDDLFPRLGPDALDESGFAVQEEQMSDFSDYSKFAVRHKKMSDALKEGDMKVTEVRPGGYDSDASVIETKRHKRRFRTGLVHLVILDIKNKQSSDKITYERQGDFDVFTAVEPYLIDKVQKRTQLIWQSTNMNYASRVIQKKTGNKRNFRIFFPYHTAQCSDSGSDDERIRREVDENFKQAQLEANHLAKMQAAQAAQMYAPPVAHSPFPQYYATPAPPHVPPQQYFRLPHPTQFAPQVTPYPPHQGVVPEPYFTIHDRHETYTSQPKRRYRVSPQSASESPTDRWTDQRHHPPKGPEADPLVEIVELYKVEERELDEESEQESPDFTRHIVLDVENKFTTDKMLYEENEDKTVTFTAKDPFLVGIIKKGERVLWRSKDGRYSKRIIMRERENDIPLLRVFLPRMKPTSSATHPRRVDLDINYKFSTNEYEYKSFFDQVPQRLTKHTYTTKGGCKFHVVRRSDHVIWRAGDDSELSDQVTVLKYHDMRTEQVMINLPDGTARRYTKPERCVNYYRNWMNMGAVPLFSPTTQSVALDVSNKYDTHYYQYTRMGDVSTFVARYGYVFTAVLDSGYAVWSSLGNEFAVSVEVVGDFEMTIQLCTANRRFRKGQNNVWFEYTDKTHVPPIYVRSSQYLI